MRENKQIQNLYTMSGCDQFNVSKMSFILDLNDLPILEKLLQNIPRIMLITLLVTMMKR